MLCRTGHVRITAALLLAQILTGLHPVLGQPLQEPVAPPGVENSLPAPNQEAVLRYPLYVTPYDIMTAEDEFYYHHLSKLCQGGDVAEWPIVKTIVNLGTDFLDANALAAAANWKINISEQPRARHITQMVRECADILGVEPPPTYIEGDPYPNAYVTGIGHPHMLVLTSGLVELYADSPDELRFIIGHELGHIKSQHLRTHLLGRFILLPLIARLRIDGVEKVSSLLANVAIKLTVFGTLMHWYRASEFSADRAGLICVGGRVSVAQQALVRLLHQTRQSNKLMDKDTEEFDVRQIKRDQTDLRHRPMVEIFSFLYQFGTTHPFIADRCIELENWSQSEDYEQLMSRPKKQDLRIQVTSIQITNIPATDTYVPAVDSGETDPLVEITYNGITHQPRYQSDRTSVTWDQLDFRYDHVASAGFIVDLYDYNTVLPNRLVGSVRLTVDGQVPGDYETTGALALDIEKESTIVDLPTVVVKYRIEKVEETVGTR
ncbi:MAG: M48 family metalloprotease [Planctomycetaceae bacterium]|nr:M48 family metalloprotease [Planctomycetaceae bacterium]